MILMWDPTSNDNNHRGGNEPDCPLPINHTRLGCMLSHDDGCCATLCSVPLLRTEEMERRSIEERFGCLGRPRCHFFFRIIARSIVDERVFR